ncbi:hypothetical protein ACYTKI_002305 [Escherichia albertii]|uniref:hypothetical protein n=1 Tax=Escherichia albertii TaxID=208962 RepID=UPI002240D3E3|nr:hypothetical protein [Escherichia albertii]QTA13675.1 hypothetical protein FYK20_23550 [Escherichia albertii]
MFNSSSRTLTLRYSLASHGHVVRPIQKVSSRIPTAACAGVRCQEASHPTVTSDALSPGYRWLNNGFFFAISLLKKGDRTIIGTACAAFLCEDRKQNDPAPFMNP